MRWSIRQTVFALVSLWCAAVAVSLAGFQAQWNTLPAQGDIVAGATLYAGHALPAGFAATLGLRVPAGEILLLAVVYWPVMFYAHYMFVRRRRPELFAGVTMLVLLSAWKWQVMAQGLIGL